MAWYWRNAAADRCALNPPQVMEEAAEGGVSEEGGNSPTLTYSSSTGTGTSSLAESPVYSTTSSLFPEGTLQPMAEPRKGVARQPGPIPQATSDQGGGLGGLRMAMGADLPALKADSLELKRETAGFPSGGDQGSHTAASPRPSAKGGEGTVAPSVQAPEGTTIKSAEEVASSATQIEQPRSKQGLATPGESSRKEASVSGAGQPPTQGAPGNNKKGRNRKASKGKKK